MLSVIIPALNEPLIARLVRRVLPHADRVIVVDEKGAALDTGALAVGAGARGVYSTEGCLAGAIAKGVGLTGIRDHVLTMDGDGAQNPDQIPSMIEAFPSADIVVGSRFTHGAYHSGKGTLHWYTSRLFSYACHLRTGLPVHDFGGGFRLYRHGIAHALFPTRSRGRAYQAEVLYEAARIECDIKEIPCMHIPTDSKQSRADILEGLQLLAWLGRDAK